MKDRSGMSPGSIFIDFEVAFESLGQLLDDLVASLPEVGFPMDFEEDPGLRHQGPVRVIPGSWPYI